MLRSLRTMMAATAATSVCGLRVGAFGCCVLATGHALMVRRIVRRMGAAIGRSLSMSGVRVGGRGGYRGRIGSAMRNRGMRR